MPRLEERMARAKEQAAEKLPDHALEISVRHTEELEREGLADRAVGEGDRAPEFRLPSTEGGGLSLSELRARGPVVLSFYRGRW